MRGQVEHAKHQRNVDKSDRFDLHGHPFPQSRAWLDSTKTRHIAGQAGSLPLTAAQIRRRQSTPFSDAGLGQARS